MSPDAFPSDYDSDPERWRVNRATVERYSRAGDTHEPVAERFLTEGLRPILDVGCGDGRLAAQLPAHAGWIGVDASRAQVAAAPRPAVLADATALPIRNGSCGAVAQLWMLYHLEDPVDAIAEAHRVLRPGGLYAASTSRRDDSPEVLEHLPPQPDSTFDAEEAADLVGEVFGAVEVDAWDGPYVHLPDRQAVASYLRGRGIDAETADEVVAAVEVPLEVTKRGCVVFARKATE